MELSVARENLALSLAASKDYRKVSSQSDCKVFHETWMACGTTISH